MMNFIFKRIDYVILAAAFLPYAFVNAGVRIEHLVLYSLLLILILQNKLFFFRKQSFAPLILIFALLIYFVSTMSLANGVQADAMFLSNIENYTETLVLFLIFSSLLLKNPFFTVERMVNLNTFFHLLLALNTGLVLIEMFTPYADYFLNLYVKSDVVGYRTATNSMGRYMGVFNLPMESGMAYSMGLLTWLYNYIRKKDKNLILEGLLFILILIGGIASVSKVFLVVGLLLFVAVFFMIGSFKKKILFLLFGSVSLFLIVPLISSGWHGLSVLESQFIKITTNFSLDNITAGRIGSGSGIYSWVLNQDTMSLLFGNGFTQGNLLHLDSEYMQILFQGGLVSLTLYLLIIIKLFIRCFSIDKKLYVEKVFLLAVLLLGTVTALGGPMFFMNRVRIIYFLQLFFLYKLSHIVYIQIKSKKNSESKSPEITASI